MCCSVILHNTKSLVKLVVKTQADETAGRNIWLPTAFNEHIGLFICLPLKIWISQQGVAEMWTLKKDRKDTVLHANHKFHWALLYSMWYPYYTFQGLVIERIQKCFLIYISYRCMGIYPKCNCNYATLLSTHGFTSLCDRCSSYSVKFLLNILLNKMGCSSPFAFFFLHKIPQRFEKRKTLTNLTRILSNFWFDKSRFWLIEYFCFSFNFIFKHYLFQQH